MGVGSLRQVEDAEPIEIPDRALRSALEFAVMIASVGQRSRPQVPFPAELKPYLRFQKLPAKALSAVRAAVEGNPNFLRALGAGAQPELVDEVGILWLQRPEGWEAQVAEQLAAAAAESDDQHAERDARAERKKREAAEAAAARSRLEVVELKESLARERQARAEAEAERDRLAKELRSAGEKVRELESANRRRERGEAAQAGRADAAVDEVTDLRARLEEAEAARDAALSARADEPEVAQADRLRALLLEALTITGPSRSDTPARRRAARTPLGIPGGLYGNSLAAAEHLLRSPGVVVLVDGYNVAKLGWPDVSLERQRALCVDAAEALARRWGTDLHVVFDGADVVGAHTRERRLVRVVYSPEGVTADDVLRAEVAALDPTRPVLVVTNDQAVLADVKAAGANSIASETFLALARR